MADLIRDLKIYLDETYFSFSEVTVDDEVYLMKILTTKKKILLYNLTGEILVFFHFLTSLYFRFRVFKL